MSERRIKTIEFDEFQSLADEFINRSSQEYREMPARIVQKFDLNGKQKIKEPARLVNSQPITENDRKRPSNSAKKAAIFIHLPKLKGKSHQPDKRNKPMKEKQRLVKLIHCLS